MNRRDFLGAVALGTAGALSGDAGESEGKGVDTFPKPKGEEFRGMEGAFAPLFTPYTKDGKVNTEMAGRVVEFLLGRGIRGFYVCGGTGEHVLLTVEERKTMLEAVIEAVHGRAKVIAHVGCTATDASAELARHAEKAGADWLASLGPLVFGQNFEASRRHYSAIAGATGLPLMIYCWYRDLDPVREAKLFDIPNIKALKYTGRNFWAVQDLKRLLNKEVVFFVGDDPHLLSGLMMDKVFSGGIGTTYNFMPRRYVKICDFARGGRSDEARKLQADANRVTSFLTADTNFSYVKAAMRYIGFDCGPVRSPFGFPLSEDEYAAFARKLDKFCELSADSMV